MPSPETGLLELHEISEARTRLQGKLRRTPTWLSEALTKELGIPTFLKMECLQKTGSFKPRGALNKLLTLSMERCRGGVVGVSGGNHAQGLAFAAKLLGLDATICMPASTPRNYLEATRAYGAKVVLCPDIVSAFAEAKRLRETGLTEVHPFDDPLVAAGQGTVGLEILEDVPDVSTVFVSIGGGGLISGVACAIKEVNPRVRIIGVEAESVPKMEAAIGAGHPVTLEPGRTIADGIAVRRAGDLTFPMVRRYVDEIVTCDDEEISNAILLLLEREKTVAEGAGAIALAAAVNRKAKVQGKKAAMLVCGGNIDVNLISRIIERGLVKDGRLVRLSVTVTDRPGALAKLAELVARHKANVVEIHHNRAFITRALGDTAIELVLETRGHDHIAEIVRELESKGYAVERG